MTYENEFTPQYEEEFEVKDPNNIQFLKKHVPFNQSITYEKLFLIPEHLRWKWWKLDLTYLDAEPPKFPEKSPIRQMSETPPDLFKMQKEKKAKLKGERIKNN